MQFSYRKSIYLALSISSIIWFLSSCKPEDNFQSADFQLQFSTDTVFFDTIFSTIGSTTQFLKVYNPQQEDISLKNIFLAKAGQSGYRLNIDGRPANSAQNIRIRGNDSIYIFVEVTIDPNRDQMLEHDSIIFNSENQQWDIDLVAFGQDIELIKAGEIYEDTHWNNTKPYLVYDYLYIAKDATLMIDQGTHVHFHRDARMYIEGSLQANGSLESPIIFQGDRLEEMYDDVPGQWVGMYFIPGSAENLMNYTEVKNAIIGIQVDTFTVENQPVLTLSNSKIQHMTSVGIYARGTNLEMYNCLVSDCGLYAVAFIYGGTYKLLGSTIANYWGQSPRQTPSLIINNYFTYQNTAFIRPLSEVQIANTIIYGSQETELAIDVIQESQEMSKISFTNTIIRQKNTEITYPELFTSCYFNTDPKFISKYEYDFHLDTISPAQYKGAAEVINLHPNYLLLDLDGVSRTQHPKPDIGAYQRIE